MLYRTRTREQYDWLMGKLEDDYRSWTNGDMPTENDDSFQKYGENTVIIDFGCGYGLLYSHIKGALEKYPNDTVTEVSKLMDDFREETEDEE